MTHPDLPRLPSAKLRRRLGLTLVVLYGLGVTIGAGIYVLIGPTAGQAGVHAPVSFIVAALVMGCSAASFAEFVCRFPVSAGEAAYVRAGFRSEIAALLVGIGVMLAGVVSSATISIGSAGYIGAFLEPLVPVNGAWLTVAIVLAVALVACIGILESVALAGLMTLVEIGGLLAIVIGGLFGPADVLGRLPEVVPLSLDGALWAGIFGAGLLAFYAFIGFEDMVNVAEEVRDPGRTMPRAILITLIVTTALYFLIAAISVLAVPPAQLSASPAPLGLVFAAVTPLSPLVIMVIAAIATFNGVIIQVIMASRVLYGLADQGTIPGWLGRVLGWVYPRTGTPVVATAVVAAVVGVLAVSFPIERLAGLTSQIVLVIFVAVNVALIAVKWRERGVLDLPADGFRVPIAIPAVGAALSLLFVLFGG